MKWKSKTPPANCRPSVYRNWLRCRHEEGVVVSHQRACACGTRATYGWPEERRRLTCKSHALPCMANLVSRTCRCGRYASYIRADGRRAACMEHKTSDMLPLRRGKRKPDMSAYPAELATRPTRVGEFRDWLVRRRDAGISNPGHTTCLCGKRSTHGWDDERVRLTCGVHAAPGMVDVSRRRVVAPTTPGVSPPPPSPATSASSTLDDLDFAPVDSLGDLGIDLLTRRDLAEMLDEIYAPLECCPPRAGCPVTHF